MRRQVAAPSSTYIGLAFACAWLALAVGAASASAAPSWLPATDISGANEVVDGRPEVAIDAAGNAVAIWERHVGGKEVVEATERPAGGEWSAPETLTLPDEEGQRSQVTIDAAGNAIAVWVSGESSTNFVIRSAVRPAGGEWSEPEDVSGPVQEAIPPFIELDAASEAVAVWTAFSGGDRIIQGAVRSTGAEWSEPEDLSADGQHTKGSPSVAIDAAGNAIAVWARSDGSDDIIQAAVRAAGGEDWSAADDLSDTGQDAHEPRVAMNSAGDAVAVWTRSNGSSDIAQAAVRATGDEWSEPKDLSVAGQHAEEARVAIDETGDAVAAWSSSNGIIQAAMRPAGDDDWAEPEDLSASGRNAFSPAVAINDAVGAVATWSRSDGSNFRVQGAVRPPGDDWQKADNLSAAGEGAGFPDVAIDAAGNAIAVFGRNGDDGPFVQAAGYDFVAPRLDALQIPATGTVGEPVAFAVSPFDMFPLAATNWTFGDGKGGAGNAVSHVYAAAGAYPVTVSAVDAGGNATSQTAAILIEPSAGPPPPPPPGGRCQIALSLAIEGKSLAKLLRSGKLGVDTTVTCAAEVALSGRAKLRVHTGKRSQTKLVPIFERKLVQFVAANERRVTLSLSERGRKVLRPLSRVRLSIAGEARDEGGSVATATARRTLTGANAL